MRKRTLMSLAAVLVALAVAVAALAPVPVDAQGKAVVWNFPHISAPTYYHTLNYQAFTNKVKEKSGGRM